MPRTQAVRTVSGSLGRKREDGKAGKAATGDGMLLKSVRGCTRSHSPFATTSWPTFVETWLSWADLPGTSSIPFRHHQHIAMIATVSTAGTSRSLKRTLITAGSVPTTCHSTALVTTAWSLSVGATRMGYCSRVYSNPAQRQKLPSSNNSLAVYNADNPSRYQCATIIA